MSKEQREGIVNGDGVRKVISDARRAALLSAFEEVYTKAARAVLRAKDPKTVERTITVEREVALPASISGRTKFYERVTYSFKGGHVTQGGYGGAPSECAGISVSDHARHIELGTLEETQDVPSSKDGRSVPSLINIENKKIPGPYNWDTCALVGRSATLKIAFVGRKKSRISAKPKAQRKQDPQSKAKARFINLDKPLPKKVVLRLAQDLVFVRMRKPSAGKLVRKLELPDYHFQVLGFTNSELRLPGQPKDTQIFDAYFAFCEGEGEIKVKLGIRGTRSQEVKVIQFKIKK